MKLVEVSVRRPVGVLMIVIAALALGGVSLRSLAIDLFPRIDLPIAAVATSYAGAAPEQIEKLVTVPLESSLRSLQGIESLTSQSQTGSSILILQFKSGTNLDNALLEVREKVDQVKRFLPDNAGDPSVLRFDPQQIPVMSLGLSGLPPERLQRIAEDQIVPRLERQAGVASVSVQGGRLREIAVELDQASLQRYGLAASQIVQALQAENRSAPVGSVSYGATELQVSVKGEFESVADIRGALVHLPSGGRITVGDVAQVRDGFAPASSLSIVNGSPAMVLSVQKQSDANTVKVAEEVNAAMEALRSDLPEGAQLSVLQDTSLIIRQSIDSVVTNMLSGAALAVLVLLLFLRSARSTIVIGVSIPIAVIATFTLMYFAGQTVNVISMGGLALGVGMMVDSSIVILENIFTHRAKGLPMKEAAIRGASELSGAVIASTMTTVVVFLPIVYVQGLASDIFTPMALSVSFSLLASLVVAITLVPVLSAHIVPKARANEKQRFAWFDRAFEGLLGVYRRALTVVLRLRRTTVLATIALLAASVFGAQWIGTEFIPASDQGQLQATIEAPAGTGLGEMQKLVEQVTARLSPFEGAIDNAFVNIGGSRFGGGGGGGRGGGANRATLTVTLVPKGERSVSTADVVQQLSRSVQEIAGADITVSELQTGFGGGSAIQISLRGPESSRLAELAEQVIWTISSVPGVFNPASSFEEGNSELGIVVDRERAAFYGLSFAQILSEVQLAMEGQIATRYREGGSEFNVKVILPEERRADLAALSTLKLRTPGGQTVPLEAVAELERLQGPAMIQRENAQRQVNVTLEVTGRDLGNVTADVQAALDRMQLPDGYTYAIGGQTQDMMESFNDLTVALVFSIVLVYIVMAVQFESLLYPFIIMFSLPPTLIGVVTGLLLTNTPLGITALIGVIILAGIVVNNAIVLVDYINLLRSRGMSREEAIREAAPSRVRPILMTTLTTVLGLVPLALGIGEGAELQAPLAITVIFGLSFSTLITLLLVPVMYVYCDRAADWVKRLFGRGDPEPAGSGFGADAAAGNGAGTPI